VLLFISFDKEVCLKTLSDSVSYLSSINIHNSIYSPSNSSILSKLFFHYFERGGYLPGKLVIEPSSWFLETLLQEDFSNLFSGHGLFYLIIVVNHYFNVIHWIQFSIIFIYSSPNKTHWSQYPQFI